MIFLRDIESKFRQKVINLSSGITNPSLKYCDAGWDHGRNIFYFEMYDWDFDKEQYIFPTFLFVVNAKSKTTINGLYDNLEFAIYSSSGPTPHDGISSTEGKLLVSKTSSNDYRFYGWFIGTDGNLYTVNHILNVYAYEYNLGSDAEITLTDGYIDAGSVPSLPLPDNDISTLKLYIDNELVHEFTTRVIDGYHTCFGIEQMVRSFMESNRLSVATVRADFCSSEKVIASQEQQVLYHAGPLRLASSSTTCDTFIKKKFLTPLKHGVVTPDMPFFFLYFYTTEAESMVVTYYLKDGSTGTSSSSFSANRLAYQGWSYRPDCYKINVSLGSRSFDIYCIDQTEGVVMRYYDFFNNLCYAFVPSSITRSPSTDFETAVQDNKTIRYDVEHQLEFSLKTAPILQALADQIYWVCRSRRVYMVEFYGKPIKEKSHEIIITDYKLDQTTNPNTPTVCEMTFEYADTTLPNVAEIY
jgi:hypothetical protein